MFRPDPFFEDRDSLGGLHFEYINLDRITSAVGLINLVHNFIRVGQLRSLTA